MSEAGGHDEAIDAVIAERIGVGTVKRASDGFEGIQVRIFWADGKVTALLDRPTAKRLADEINMML